MFSTTKTIFVLLWGLCSVCLALDLTANNGNNYIVSNYVRQISRRVRQISFCRGNEFQCGTSGQCVSRFSMCDGIVDCDDRSDETAERCTKQRCPSGTFRCKYGACVSISAKCDGFRDCADNSDENLPECREKTTLRKSRLCGDRQFVCDSGQCISLYDVCDGIANCQDKSDETVEICGKLMCDSRFFQCSYGACIDKQLVCNGVADCVDNSDETSAQCNNNRKQLNYYQSNGECRYFTRKQIKLVFALIFSQFLK